jgi:hypothetical protein
VLLKITSQSLYLSSVEAAAQPSMFFLKHHAKVAMGFSLPFSTPKWLRISLCSFFFFSLSLSLSFENRSSVGTVLSINSAKT